MTGCGGTPSRDPSEYTFSRHFIKHILNNNFRFFTKNRLAETIRDGKDCDRIEAGRGNLRRKKTFEGVTTVIAIPEHDPFVITGWTNIKSVSEALSSDTWDQEQINAIQAFDDFRSKEMQQYSTHENNIGCKTIQQLPIE